MKNTIRFALLCALGLAAPMTYAAEAVDKSHRSLQLQVSGRRSDAEQRLCYWPALWQRHQIWIDGSGQHGFIAAESDQGFNWWGDRFTS